MSQPETTGSQIRIFVGQTAHGRNGAQEAVNSWLAKNPLLMVKTVQTSIPGGGGVVVTIWYEGIAVD